MGFRESYPNSVRRRRSNPPRFRVSSFRAGTGLGFTPSNIVDDDIYSGSSSSDSSDDEGGDNTKKNKNNNDNSDDESSNSDMMSLHSDVSSDDFNNDAMDVEKMLQLDRLD